MMSMLPPNTGRFFILAFVVAVQTANVVTTTNAVTIASAIFLWFLFLRMVFQTAWRV